MKILSLILSPSRYEKIEGLSKYQSVNPPSKPLIGLPKVEQEAYLVKLSDDVLRAAEEAQATRDKVNPIKVNPIRFCLGRKCSANCPDFFHKPVKTTR